MATTDELLDNLMKNCKKPEDLLGDNSLLSQLFRTTLQPAKQSGMAELPDIVYSGVGGLITKK